MLLDIGYFVSVGRNRSRNY